MEIINAIIAYLFGSIHFAYLIGKLYRKDISKIHDENLGAYNLYRSTKSIKLFLFAGILDGLKAFLPTILMGPFYGFVAILGHVFSVFSYYKTKRVINGMGIASTIGFFLAFDYKILLLYLSLLLFHKTVMTKLVSNRIRIFGKHLYQLIYFYLTVMIYSTLIPTSRNEYIILISILILLTIAFVYRWVIFVRKKVLPNISPKKLKGIMEEN